VPQGLLQHLARQDHLHQYLVYLPLVVAVAVTMPLVAVLVTQVDQVVEVPKALLREVELLVKVTMVAVVLLILALVVAVVALVRLVVLIQVLMVVLAEQEQRAQ
jgi:hypothetical protein